MSGRSKKKGGRKQLTAPKQQCPAGCQPDLYEDAETCETERQQQIRARRRRFCQIGGQRYLSSHRRKASFWRDPRSCMWLELELEPERRGDGLGRRLTLIHSAYVLYEVKQGVIIRGTMTLLCNSNSGRQMFVHPRVSIQSQVVNAF